MDFHENYEVAKSNITELNGIPWNLVGAISNDTWVPWNSMAFHGTFSRCADSMEFHGIPWNLVFKSSVPWNF